MTGSEVDGRIPSKFKCCGNKHTQHTVPAFKKFRYKKHIVILHYSFYNSMDSPLPSW